MARTLRFSPCFVVNFEIWFLIFKLSMMDIKFIKENISLMREVIKNKRVSLDLDKLLELDNQRRELISASENIRSQQKKLGPNDREQAGKLKEEYKKQEEQLKTIDAEFSQMMLLTPNIYSPQTPIGKDECDNQEALTWGKPTEFSFQPKDHMQLGKSLDIIDTERGTEVSGFRGYYLKNEGALLQMALMNYALDKLREKGYSLMITPAILRERALVGSGHFPQGRENIYQIASAPDLCKEEEEKEPKYLAGTSESALLAYYGDQTLDLKKMPVKMAAFSPCFRSEIGSYGKDTKGLYRVHEFFKVEQVILCPADMEQAQALFDELRQNSCELLQELGLPYRVLNICTGDMGAGKYEMNDIETWMPSRKAYGETHSNSNLTDWQARRLNIKYKDSEGNKKFAFTLNNTMVASPRILIALLENCQQEDGSVLIPEVLQKYTGFAKISPK